MSTLQVRSKKEEKKSFREKLCFSETFSFYKFFKKVFKSCNKTFCHSVIMYVRTWKKRIGNKSFKKFNCFRKTCNKWSDCYVIMSVVKYKGVQREYTRCLGDCIEGESIIQIPVQKWKIWLRHKTYEKIKELYIWSCLSLMIL